MGGGDTHGSLAAIGARGAPDPTPPVLTADLCARAVIAAARIYGDDPVRACTTNARSLRRALTAAAGGLSRALELTAEQCGRPLGVKKSAIHSARCLSKGAFAAAEAAAMRAVEFAAWQADASESVVDEEEALDLVEDEAPAEEEPEPVVAPRPPTAGPVSAWIAPQVARAAPPTSSSALPDRLLAQLAEGPATTIGLATLLDVKELPVSQMLGVLKFEGRVEAGEMPPEGRRHQRWRLA